MFNQKTIVGQSQQQEWLHHWSHFFPILDWGLHYQPEYLVGDITAGIVVGTVLIPQAMAYALLAGLPPQIWIVKGWVCGRVRERPCFFNY